MSRQYLELGVNRHNAALFSPATGTAPHNEVTAMHNNAERDHNEATQPDTAANASTDLPDGFRWDRQKNGKLIAVPTRDNIAELHQLASEFFAEREMRDQEMPRDAKLTKALNSVYAQMTEASEFLANGFLYNLANGMAQELAGSLSWVRIHATNISRYNESGNEEAAENSLINLEASRSQALKAAQVLDYLQSKHNIEPNLLKGVQNALGLAGWRLANPKVSADRKAVQQTTRDYLFSKPPRQPDEVLEQQQQARDELEDSLDVVNAA